MKILLFGKNGQVGWELQRALAPLGEPIALDIHDCDLTDRSAIRRAVSTSKPDCIVNAAAYTAVDKAEQEEGLAFAVNAEAPGVMAREAARIGALLVHYSTDYVFDGTGDKAWRESDPVSPLSVYGRSKWAGEQAIQEAGCGHLILRTSWVFAALGNNFAKTILRLARERDRLNVIDDQIGAPTGADLLADLTAHAIPRFLSRPELGGLYHVTAAGETSWHGYACFVLETAGDLGLRLKTDSARVERIPSSGFKTPARRPLNSRLDTRKFERSFGLRLPPWQVGVRRMLREIIPGEG